MAEKQKFPQIPGTVWWGVRSILQKSPRATVDERMLGVQLGVQEAAARQYIAELKNVGILDDDGRATSLAAKWRLDESYDEAVSELVTKNYPEGLVDLTHPREGERHKVVSWFEREGLGRGAAGNKAATYLLIGSPLPSDMPDKKGRKKREGDKRVANVEARVKPQSTVAMKRSSSGSSGGGTRNDASAMPLHVNVQIHISADAGVDQINAIFSAMKRYLSDSENA